jgi:hypothetical protein
MGYDELKAAVLNLDQSQQKQLLMEVLKELLPKVCNDEACLDQIRNFVDEETIRSYREQHMDSV